MNFEQITYNGLHKESTLVNFTSLEFLKEVMNRRFNDEDEVCRYEEMKLENGKTSLSLRDKGNKLIVQYKTT